MTDNDNLAPSVYQGWRSYQHLMIEALAPLDPAQLALRTSPKLRSVGEIAVHIIGARARWFYFLMGEGGDAFEEYGRWDGRKAKVRSAKELVGGLEETWIGMHSAIAGWSPEEWQKTWPGESTSEPETITRQWVIWHLIEHDLHHGGEISIILGAHSLPGIAL